MADFGNPRTVFSNAILYEAYRRSVWLNVANRTWEEGLVNAKTVAIPDMTDNIAVDNPADADALQTALTYKNATMAGINMVRGFVRAGAKIPMDLLDRAGGGAEAEAALATRMGVLIAQNIDEKIAAEVAGQTYDTVNGSGNDNSVPIGSAGSNFIATAFPYSASGTILKDMANALLNIKALLVTKGVVDGNLVGAGGGNGDAVAVLPTALAINLVKYLRDNGDLVTRESIAGQAAIEAGIASTTAFQGRYAGIDIVASDATGVAKSNAAWMGYVTVAGGPLAAAAFAPRIDEQRFGDGTTAGLYEMRRTAVGAYAAKVTRPEHIVQLSVAQK